MKKVLAALLAAVTGMGILLSLALTAVQIVAFDRARYRKAYEQYGIYDEVGITEDGLMEVTDQLLDYLRLKEDSLVMHQVIRGEMQQVFEERELLHMVDVRSLFIAGYTIRRVAVTAALLGIALLILWKRKAALLRISHGYLAALALFVIFAVILGIAMATDFNRTFILFHQLLFDNDLWLLDPATDVMIQMFPEDFFSQMATSILAWMSGLVLVPALAAAAYSIFSGRRAHKDAH